MSGLDVQDYARQLFEAHGPKAVAEAGLFSSFEIQRF